MGVGTTIQSADGTRNATVTAGGALLVAAGGGGSATGTQSTAAATGADQLILAANTNREGATVYNDSTALLYLLVAAGTASTSVFTVLMNSGSYYEVPFGYTGAIRGIYASATGNARVTEYTT